MGQFHSNPVLRLEFIGILVGKFFYNQFLGTGEVVLNNMPHLLKYLCVCLDTNVNPSAIALGMEDRLILDSQIFVSSSKDDFTSGGDNARLNPTNNSTVSNGSWVAGQNDDDPWLMVDFISNVTISEISTQSSENGSSYVSSYTLAFGDTRNTLQDYQVNGLVKVKILFVC